MLWAQWVFPFFLSVLHCSPAGLAVYCENFAFIDLQLWQFCFSHQWNKFSQCTANPAGSQSKTKRKTEKPILLRAFSFFHATNALVGSESEKKVPFKKSLLSLSVQVSREQQLDKAMILNEVWSLSFFNQTQVQNMTKLMEHLGCIRTVGEQFK